MGDTIGSDTEGELEAEADGNRVGEAEGVGEAEVMLQLRLL